MYNLPLEWFMVCTKDAGVSDRVFASFNINGLFAQVGGMIRLLCSVCVCLCHVLVALDEDYEGSEVL